MRRLFVVVSVALLAFAGTAGPAFGKGVDPDKLEKAGWFCFPAQGFVHCVPDGDAVFSGQTVASTVLAFDEADNLIGTELLLHEAVYKDQPCPQDEVAGGDGTYIDLSGQGIPYFVCHHFDSPAT